MHLLGFKREWERDLTKMLLQQWREAIEETKKKILLLQELETAEVPKFGEDDMKEDIAIAVDFSLETEAGYRHLRQ